MALGRVAQRLVCSVSRPKAFPSWKAGAGAEQGQAAVGGDLVALKSCHPQARPTLCTSQCSRLGLGLTGLQRHTIPQPGRDTAHRGTFRNPPQLPAPLGHQDSSLKKRENRPEGTGGKTAPYDGDKPRCYGH